MSEKVKCEDCVFAPFKDIAKDRVNVVRCKDCKYKVETEDGEWNPEDIVCDYWASDGLEADDFCSRGERKKPTEF